MSRPLLPESAYEALGLSADALHDLMNPKPIPEETKVHAPNLLHSDEDHARPMAPNETSITLYAELLLHIRTVTLFASLRTNHSTETKAKLSADGSYITVSHEGQSATIRLPINVKGGGDAALSLPSQPPSKELTLRLQMEEREGSDLLGRMQGDERGANIVPWSGAALSKAPSEVEIACQRCSSVLLCRGKITEWRDLPNENWAEMMDFWHCHKPDEHHLHDHTHEETMGMKGYAAGNKLQAVKGVGFVDLTSFLFKEEDCEGVKTSQDTDLLTCTSCSTTIGTHEPLYNGWRIHKYSISLSFTLPSDDSTQESSAPTPTSFSTEKWISARLLHLIENTGIRKFLIHPPLPPKSTVPAASLTHDTPAQEAAIEEQDPSWIPTPTSIPSLLLWLFTPDLLFSSSKHPGPSPTTYPRRDPTRALKIFYQHQTYTPLAPGMPEPAGVEDVEFPADLYELLEEGLGRSQGVLPRTARRWGVWEVGLLGRFEVGDDGMSGAEEGQGREGDGEGEEAGKEEEEGERL